MSVDRARELRKKMTDAERLLWSRLRRRQIHGRRFRRQHPKLVIKLDGGQHARRKDEDAARTRSLAEKGYRVLRFWNNQVLGEIDAVVQVIAAATLAAPLPSPPPCGGRE